MSPKPDLNTLLDAGEKHARRVLLLDGNPELLPMFHLVTPKEDEGDIVMACMWRDDTEKQMIVGTVRAKSHEVGAVAVMFIGEAWMLMVDNPGKTPWHMDRALEQAGPPSEHPNRVEIVALTVTDGKESRGRTLQIVRDKPGGKIISLVRQPDLAGVDGRMIEGMIKRGR